MSTNITVLESSEVTALAVFTAKNGLDDFLQEIEKEARSIVPDVTTKKGRDHIASMAYKVRQSKTALDKIGKALVDKLKEQPKLIDAERKRMRDYLDALADDVRAPLDEFEAKEAARVNAHKAVVDHITALGNAESLSSIEQFYGRIKEIEDIAVDSNLEEFESDSHKAKFEALKAVNAALDAHKIRVAEQEELAKLRAESEERARKEREEAIAREAAERATRDAEEKAKREKEAAEKRELELKLAAERALRQKAEAEERAKMAAIEAEQRIKREAEEKRLAEEEEQRKREANKAHKARINNDILNDFAKTGITEDQAKALIRMIASNEVKHVKILY